MPLQNCSCCVGENFFFFSPKVVTIVIYSYSNCIDVVLDLLHGDASVLFLAILS